MSAGVTGLHSPAKPVTETPEILGPGENRMRVPAEEGKKKKKDMDNKKQQQIPVANANYVVVAAKKLVTQSERQRQRLRLQSTKPVVGSKKEDGSSTTDSISSSSDCSSIDGTPTPAPVVGQGLTTSKKKNGTSVQKAAKVVPVVGRFQILKVSPILVPGPLKRCDWITLNSDPIYTKFHDEEWGVPVHDEIRLFELFVLSQALSEHTWPTILNKRNTFRIMFDNFDPSSIASFDEKKIQSMETKGNFLLSEPKLLAIVENAKQVLKIRREFGSFSNYCWNFVNHKPIRNGFKYARQVPAKTPKSELLSKDMMRRGFQRVGPTVVYSFMQVSGMANDHLISCFRYTICNDNNNNSEDKTIENRDLSEKAWEETNAL